MFLISNQLLMLLIEPSCIGSPIALVEYRRIRSSDPKSKLKSLAGDI